MITGDTKICLIALNISTGSVKVRKNLWISSMYTLFDLSVKSHVNNWLLINVNWLCLFRFVKFIIFKIRQKIWHKFYCWKQAVLVYRCTYNRLSTTVKKENKTWRYIIRFLSLFRWFIINVHIRRSI
jgi:hypothetical protein